MHMPAAAMTVLALLVLCLLLPLLCCPFAAVGQALGV